jgi:hypothetical protein
MRGRGVARLYVHTITVEEFLGTSGYGVDQFGAPTVLAPPNGCFVDDSTKLTRNGKGEEVVSSSTVYTATSNAALFTTGARVTTTSRVSRVIKVNVNDSGALDLPDHVAVSLE